MRLPWLTALLLLTGCGGAAAGEGLDLWLRVRGAQLVRDVFPDVTGGPAVTSVEVLNSRIFPGDTQTPLQGRVSGDGYAVNLGIEGDRGYWIHRVAVPDDAVAGELLWSAQLDFSRALPAGPVTLKLQATGPGGEFGEVSTIQLTAQDPLPSGPLVFSLEWDQAIDADLYLRTPSGVVLSPKNVNTVQPSQPGGPLQPPDAFTKGGYLDVDSNGSCVIDGLQRESAIFPATFERGTYTVFAAVAYACGVPQSAFRVTARRDGAVVGASAGVLYEADARGSALTTSGSPGLLALELDIQ